MLIISTTGDNNSFLVKSKRNGGVQFSRDPFNLINKNTRKQAGFVNDKVRTSKPGQGQEGRRTVLRRTVLTQGRIA